MKRSKNHDEYISKKKLHIFIGKDEKPPSPYCYWTAKNIYYTCGKYWNLSNLIHDIRD